MNDKVYLLSPYSLYVLFQHPSFHTYTAFLKGQKKHDSLSLREGTFYVPHTRDRSRNHQSEPRLSENRGYSAKPLQSSRE